MLISTMILGWIGVLLYLIIIFTFKKMARSNEYAFLHLLMALMYAMWLPLPLALHQLIESDALLVGTVFGLAYLIMLVISMVLQTGHIAFISKCNEDYSITEKHTEYMMATFTKPFESLLGIFKSILALFLAISFWKSDEYTTAIIMFFFGLFIFYYLLITLDASLVKRVKLLSKVKPNVVIVNLETVAFFIILMSYVTLNA
ncbi:hypothetical protein M3152_04720 [Sporosarcina luteola]|uniref:hypothetical protein n=1 Tax=Sporosarcina luteola TaxID=582850 RepID=UPI00203A8F17|nr:hypothetical protein [Sporosarcina luteola]MCM3637016.1 hypothetical protein [Sporosarcina luteola]